MSPFGFLLCLAWLVAGLIAGFSVRVSITSIPARVAVLWLGYFVGLLVFLFQPPGWDRFIWFVFLVAAAIGWTLGLTRLSRHRRT